MAKSDDVKRCLERAGHEVGQDNVNDNQAQFWVTGIDAVVNVWHSTETCTVQGRDKATLESILGPLVGKGRKRAARQSSTGTSAAAPGKPKKVFVVYGHDKSALTEADAMLRRWGLDPQILDKLPSHGNTIIEKLEHYQDGVEWAIVLLTPDDLGHRALDPSSAAPRPRQNVVLEMGMLLGKLGRTRVAMLYRVSEPEMELPSDIQGYLYIAFTDSVEETGHELAKEMAAAGFHRVPVEDI